MSFGSALLRKNVSVNNLNFILYIIKAVKATEEIKNLFFDFLKNNIQLFMNNTMQNLNSVLVSIIEEIVLLDKLNENDISTIIEMISGKYKISFDTMNTFVSQMRNNSNLAQSMLDNQLTHFLNRIFLLKSFNHPIFGAHILPHSDRKFCSSSTFISSSTIRLFCNCSCVAGVFLGRPLG